MSTRLGIVRTDTVLDAYHLKQNRVVEAPAVDQEDWFVGSSAWTIVRAPLDAGDRLAEIWQRLARPRVLDLALLVDLSAVLAETLFDTTRRWPSAPALPGEAPPPPQPTAAHPRAYRGTRYTPPKPREVTVSDVRPHLVHSASTRALLERLAASGATLPETSVAMDDKRLERVAAPEPMLADAPSEAARWAAGFREVWLPALLGGPWSSISALHGVWRVLGLERDAGLSAAALALAIDVGPTAAVDWLRDIAALPPDARSPWVHAVMGSGLIGSGVHFERPIVELDGAIDRSGHEWRIWQLCAHRARGGASVYLLQGLSWHAAHGGFWPDRVPSGGLRIDESVTWRFLEHTEAEEGEPARRIIRLWARCGDFPGLIDVLRAVNAVELSPRHAALFVSAMTTIEDEDDDPAAAAVAARWAWLHAHRDALLDAVLSCAPAQRLRAIHLLWDGIDFTTGAIGLTALMQRQLRLVPQLCSATGNSTRWVSETVTTVADTLDDALFERVVMAPPAGWRAALDACRLKNPSRLVESGTATLTACAPVLFVDGFVHAPKPLWRTARMPGAMRVERSRVAVKTVLNSPLVHRDWRAWPLDALCAALAERVVAGVPDPVPRALKAHFAGSARLSPGRLARQHRRLLRPEARVTTVLGLIRAAAADAVAEGFGVETADDGVLHALQIMATVDLNRRVLRRVLRAHWRGAPDVVRSHPKTRRWWAQHPAIDEAAWRAERAVSIPGAEPITLRVETDPIQVLRMGTEVDSCLGLGGWFAFSAAAVVVDDNKRVIYARDRAGRIVARQLVALSEDDQLVCFHIYPERVEAAVRRAFARLAAQWARALGVELFDDDGPDEYDVALILAERWWDDGAAGVPTSS